MHLCLCDSSHKCPGLHKRECNFLKRKMLRDFTSSDRILTLSPHQHDIPDMTSFICVDATNARNTDVVVLELFVQEFQDRMPSFFGARPSTNQTNIEIKSDWIADFGKLVANDLRQNGFRRRPNDFL